MEAVEVVNTSESYVARFRIHGITTTFTFTEPPEDVSELEWIRQGFNELVINMKSDALETDMLGFTLHSLNFKRKEPGYVSFRPASEVDGDVLWKIFEGIVQSNSESITSTDTMRVECTRVSLPVGSGKVRPGRFDNYLNECSDRRSIINIKNKDNLCLARAIVVAKAHVKKDPLYALIRQDKGQRQTKKAKKLLEKAQVTIPVGGAGIPELEKFQTHLKKYKITVYNYNTKGRDVYFQGKNDSFVHRINLLFCNGHFNVITKLNAAFGSSYFCEHCHVPYDHKGSHRCKYTCRSCLTITPPCALEGEGIECPKCNRHFKNQICFTAHQSETCKSYHKCKECAKTIPLHCRKSEHKCGEVFCSVCIDYKDPNHKCFMKPDDRKPMTKDFIYIFFDFESRQDEPLAPGQSEKAHRVNLCVSKQYCYLCIEDKQCDTCINRTRVFKGDVINDFVKYILDVRKKFKSVCVIAHNGQGYDFIFILKYILENTKFTPDLIMRGTKVILMKLDNVRFIDSLNYLPMSLSALPKALDLPPEQKKGYFPHLFNTLSNQNYKGPMPPRTSYCPDSMFEKTHESFEHWYNEQVNSNYVFDFQKELLEYCMSDVEILAQACIKFRKLLLEQCNVDPFLEAVTIASACNLVYRRNFLKPDTIGLIPKQGYRLNDTCSAVSLQWLSWEESQRGVQIEHAGRGKEKKIYGHKVDGFDGERVYQFQGCYFHGCPKCFPHKRDDYLNDDPSDTLNSRYSRTLSTSAKLSGGEYELVEMWECEFYKLKKEKNLKHLDNLPILNTLPLNPRDAFFGGRTGNSKVYHKCEAGEEIRYVDVCSLYPWVCKYGKFPIAHPRIHVGDEECRKRGIGVEGLIKCKVLPPRDLYHPVLPVKLHDKLMFILCRSCGESLNQNTCEHTEKERALTATWTMDEIREAVNNGYRVVEMFEIWEYDVKTFEQGGLFTEFIDTFLKMKQEASGYPDWCRDDQDKKNYVDDYFEHEGIRLDPAKIKKNLGLRSVAKIMLVSFWGKLGQRPNQARTSIIRDPQALFSLLTTPSVQVNTIQTINDEAVLVNWQHIEEVSESLRNVNVALAAYTTAQARLKLYSHLKTLGEQVLYNDTDSVLYIWKEGLPTITTGDYLGEMTDELLEYGQGSHIVEFVSGGPKTYGYAVYTTNDKTMRPNFTFVCKVKGLTLNMKASESLNFQSLKKMVISPSDPMEMTENRIRRTRDRDIVTVSETKLFKITGPKRRRIGDFDTLPYGFKN